MMFKLVTLDVTGTLLKLKHPVGEIYAAAGKCFGIEADPKRLTACFMKNYEHMSNIHPNFGLSTRLGWQYWWKSLVSMTFKCALNASENNANLEKSLDLVGNHLNDLFSRSDGWRHAEGSVDFLNFLKDKGACIGAISNFDPRLHGILEDFGIKNFFSFIITSYECGLLKPDINIFKKAELEYEKLSKIKFDSSIALHIGDSFERDILGAERAGWSAILVSKASPRGKIQGDKYSVVSNLKEAQQFILKKIRYDWDVH